MENNISLIYMRLYDRGEKISGTEIKINKIIFSK
jgi:hypothetical protein